MLRGTLDDFGLPEVFRLLGRGGRTGRLEVERSEGTGRVFLKNGEAVFAESSASREPLGKKLIRAGALTDIQLKRALEEHASTGKRVGEVLVDWGIVAQVQIQEALRGQIADAAADLLRWEGGEFLWEPGIEIDVDVPFSVGIEELIDDANKRLEELEEIKRKIPSDDVVLTMAPKPPEGQIAINISSDEWRVLVLVDGQRSVSDIATMVGMDTFEATRMLYQMMLEGLILMPEDGEELPRRERGAEEPPPPPFEEPAGSDPAAFEPEEAFEEQAGETAESETPAASNVVELPTDRPDHTFSEIDSEGVEESAHVVELSTEYSEGTSEESFEFDIPTAEGSFEPEVQAEETFEPEAQAEETFEPEAQAEETFEPEPQTEESFEPEVQAEESFEPEPQTEESFGFETPAAEFEVISEESFEPAETQAEESFDFESAQESFVPDAPAEETFVPEPPVFDETPSYEEPPPPPPAPQTDTPRVDRAAVVRELAGLFSEEDRPRPRSVPNQPEASAEEHKQRVEDDDDINRGLISRMIDGVKGL